MLKKVKEEMLFLSKVAKADEVELQEITENAARSMGSLIAQLEGESSEDLLMCKLLGLDKQLRSIRGTLKVKMTKRLSYSNTSSKKSVRSRKSGAIQNMMMGFEKTSGSKLPS